MRLVHCAPLIEKGRVGMVKHYKSIPGLAINLKGWFNLIILSILFFLLSAALHADVSPNVERFTVQRDRASAAEIQAEDHADITSFTTQREGIPESDPTTLKSGYLPEIEIIEHGGVYQIKVVAKIKAPAHYVRYVLTDYTHIYRLNPSIIESEVLKCDDDGSVSVKIKVIGCAAYFCEELTKVEKVRLLQSCDIYAAIDPEQSQFKSGQTHWRIETQGDYSQVTYISDMEPDIFIPPVVGKFLIKKSIRQEMQSSFENLEKISSVLAEREWQENYRFPTLSLSVPCNENVSATFSRKDE